jgi:glycosyltransferase involved in cell wall biosynthesis
VPVVTHLVSLQRGGGVEAHFTEFVRRAGRTHPEWSHAWLNPTRDLYPNYREDLQGALVASARTKYLGPVKLPAKPAALRVWHCRRALVAARADALVLWNRSEKVQFALDAAGARRCIHWEHGAAWDAGRERERREYFARVGVAIANSRASARILELLWGYSGDIHVCRNALRPTLVPPVPQRRKFPTGAVKLGVAARLVPVKGVAIALHALKLLRDEAFDAELHVAGVGPEREQLERVAKSLRVDSRVHFEGAIRDMPAFYRRIDCLVHPPLTEAFGLVVIEAAAFGCPAVAAAIDGLPEAVAEGVTGECVRPTLSLADYVELGGTRNGLPPLVYDPARDELIEPPIVAPDALAAVIKRFFSNAPTFESLSARASEHVLATSDFDRHIEDVMRVIAGSRH